jgi:DNA-binding response OmpR family regulator
MTVKLKSLVYDVISATDGEEGLNKALTEKPDIILLDISMPKMNGHETLTKLRRDPWGKDVPVLFLTNFDDATNISQGVAAHSDDYIIKSSTSLEEIVKRTTQHLAGYRD